MFRFALGLGSFSMLSLSVAASGCASSERAADTTLFASAALDGKAPGGGELNWFADEAFPSRVDNYTQVVFRYPSLHGHRIAATNDRLATESRFPASAGLDRAARQFCWHIGYHDAVAQDTTRQTGKVGKLQTFAHKIRFARASDRQESIYALEDLDTETWFSSITCRGENTKPPANDVEFYGDKRTAVTVDVAGRTASILPRSFSFDIRDFFNDPTQTLCERRHLSRVGSKANIQKTGATLALASCAMPATATDRELYECYAAYFKNDAWKLPELYRISPRPGQSIEYPIYTTFTCRTAFRDQDAGTLATGEGAAGIQFIHAASYDEARPIAPGAFGSAKAKGMGFRKGEMLPPESASWKNGNETTLNGVSLTIAGQPAKISYANDNQVNYIAPATTPPGQQDVVIRFNDEVVAIGKVNVALVAPGLFVDGSGVPRGNVYERGRAPRDIASGDLYASVPGQPTVLELYGTGFRHGTTVYAWADVNGQDLPLHVAGTGTPADGLDQVNIELPPEVNVSTTLRIAVDGVDAKRVNLRVRAE
jgi:uncharacterized protein (TIGR03437 family)